MAPDYRSYLATQIISEKQTVSYRTVSRALKVHVNSAKCMLHEFWEKENKKSAGSIYAIYLIVGTKKQEDDVVQANGNGTHNEEDEPVPSSPPFNSSMIDPSQSHQSTEHKEVIPVKTIALVREENLESTKEQFEDITSIHLYSLSPGRLQDLVGLTDISRAIYTESFGKEDPLTANKTYGVIQNPGVRRRKGKRPTIPSIPTAKIKPITEAKKSEVVKTEPTPKSTTAQNTSKVEAKENLRPSSRDSSTSAASTKQPTLKGDGSSLFKAFAKAQNKPKLERKDTDASTNASISGAEDVKMTDADEEGESDNDALFLDTGTRKVGSRKRLSDVKQEREDKHAKLRKVMMDSDDDDDEDDEEENGKEKDKKKPQHANGTAGTDGEKANNNNNDDDDDAEVAWSDSDNESKSKSDQKPKSTTKADPELPSSPNAPEPKRKRGKRKIMKKRTTKDEDGFLVTNEEAVWESFSESDHDDDNSTALKSSATTAAASKAKGAGGEKASAAKSGTPAASGTAAAATTTKKKGGNIMSFFGKK